MTTREDFASFRARRKAENDRVLATNNLTIKRFFSLDNAAYRDGALPAQTKELLGLVASAVMRCNDCIDYHLEQCIAHGTTESEVEEALGVALLVGGSIVIPHMRHARTSLDFLLDERNDGN